LSKDTTTNPDSDRQNKKNLPAESDIEKQAPPNPRKEISTSRKHGMDYFTTDGVVLRTGYKNKVDWYLLPIREILDNNVDFLWKYYKGSDKASIKIDIKMDDEIFHLKIRNSNDDNIPVFPNLKAIFDYGMRYGSKQDVHIITRGMLGDAMKQILSLGYVLVHVNDDGTQFKEDKQWDYPLIIRHNNQEWIVNVNYNRAQQEPDVTTVKSNKKIAFTDTEIELKLPVIDEVRDSLTRDYIVKFYRKYILFTTDISFKFSIIDDINHSNDNAQEVVYDDIPHDFVKKLSEIPEKGILHIDTPALHPISLEKDWSNADSIHSYKPDEFMGRIQNVHDKDISVYDILLNFREGSQIKKTPDNEISISQLVSGKNKHKIMEKFFNQLQEALDPQKELSLPYTTFAKKRREALYSRIEESKIYDIDTEKEYSYKLVRGEKNQGIVKYPFAFEILAIPLKDPLIQNSPAIAKDTEFIGAVNYSVSPKSNNFQGEYQIKMFQKGKDIFDILHYNGFQKNPGNKIKLPCIVIGNLITPRRDPVGYDKSIIDTEPFAKTIIEAVEKMASGIQTYHQAGHHFTIFRDTSSAKFFGTEKNKETGKESVRQFLEREFGLPKRG